jgi:hypothetical protein
MTLTDPTASDRGWADVEAAASSAAASTTPAARKNLERDP